VGLTWEVADTLGKDGAAWQRYAALVKYGGYSCACNESVVVSTTSLVCSSTGPETKDYTTCGILMFSWANVTG
jgi:hypothetical protein